MYGSEQVAEVLIESTSIRRVALMKEDFIRLDFTLDRAIPFRIGCHIDDELFGRFIIRKEQMPQYQENTGGYKYQLQFDAEYMHAEDSTYMLTVQKDSPTEKDAFIPVRESADFSLTADLAGQLNSWMICAEAIGAGVSFNPDTDIVLPADQQKDVHSVELMKFSRRGMLTALGDICSKWSVEYWFLREGDGYRMKVGKCEAGTGRVDLELGVNVARMSINDGTKDYANRLFVFGGTNNIAFDYRKVIQNSIAGYCRITRNNIPFYVFKLANNRADFVEALFTSGGTEQHSGSAGVGTFINDNDITRFRANISGRFSVLTERYVPDGGNKAATATITVKVYTKTRGGTQTEIGSKTITINGVATWDRYYFLEGTAYGRYHFEATGLDFGVFAQEYQPSSRFSGEVFSNITTSSWSIADVESSGSDPHRVALEVVYSYSVPSAKLAIEVNDDNGEQRVHKTIYIWFYDDVSNIGQTSQADYQHNIVVFSDTPTIDWDASYEHTQREDSFTKLYTRDRLLNVLYTGYTGDTYIGSVSGAKMMNLPSDNPNTPSRIYTSPYDDPSALLRLGESRLRLPEDTGGYLETEEGANPDTRIERCVIFNEVYPRLELYVSDLLATDETETQEYEGEEKATQWIFKQYFAKLSFIGGQTLTRNNFGKKYLLDGSTPKIKFMSPRDFGKADSDYLGKCLLSGMEFDLEWMPNGVYYNNGETEPTLWGANGCFKILRNDTYGSKLPGEELKPQKQDLCTLQGVSMRVFGRTDAYITAQNTLKEKGLAYLSALKEGNFTFDCTMLTDFMRRVAINEQEELASQNELAFTLPSPTSTNADILYLGRKVRILNDSLPDKEQVIRSTNIIAAESFSEFAVGILLSPETITIPGGESVEISTTETSDYIFLAWDAMSEIKAGLGSVTLYNDQEEEIAAYVGIGMFSVVEADELSGENIPGIGWVLFSNEEYRLDPGSTIYVQSDNDMTYIFPYDGNVPLVSGANVSYTNSSQEPVSVWVGVKETAADVIVSISGQAQDILALTKREIGVKESRVIGYELKLDCPEDGARYTIGETEAYSRLDKLEKEISKS